jgi:hypothetical protein
MNKIIAALALMVAATAATAATQIPSGPGDKGVYFMHGNVIEKGIRTVLTERQGPSGTSFSIRNFDCKAGTFRYFAEGNTPAELAENVKKGPLEKSMSVVTFGSATFYVMSAACK